MNIALCVWSISGDLVHCTLLECVMFDVCVKVWWLPLMLANVHSLYSAPSMVVMCWNIHVLFSLKVCQIYFCLVFNIFSYCLGIRNWLEPFLLSMHSVLSFPNSSGLGVPNWYEHCSLVHYVWKSSMPSTLIVLGMFNWNWSLKVS